MPTHLRRVVEGPREGGPPHALDVTSPVTSFYEIGPFRLDPRVRALTYRTTPVPIGPRAVAVLTVLVENAPGYVAKERIVETAWPGLVVEEGNLSVQISAIRRALAREPGGEKWIETLSRRGYRFVGPVVERHGVDAAIGPARTSNLPRPLTSFVGRQRELREVARLLSERRLLTLIGAGGVGKTRLASELAHATQDSYRDGARWVDLAAVSDGEAVLAALARALAVGEQAGMPLVEAVSAHLQGSNLLLILDNCEHVVQACAGMAEDLLATAPDMRIVATSREPLHVAGEQLYRVRPLEVAQAAGTIDDDLQCDAVRLFVERARLRCPDFEIGDANASTVLMLCRRLDGLPLAIELAAARLEALSLDTLAERVDDRGLQLLANVFHSGAPRHRTLRATVEWSYALLSDNEKRMLARLAIFPSSWSLTAGEAIVEGGEIEKSSVVNLLGRLVDKSLIVAEPRGGRYRMLDTIRQFAREKLEELPDRSDLGARFAAFYVDLAERTEPRMFGSEQRSALEVMEVEVDNIAKAFELCRRIADGPQLALRLAVATRPFWLIRGLLGTGLRVTLEALSIGTRAKPSALLAGTYVSAAQINHYMGHNAEARSQAIVARDIARAVGHCGWQSLALTTLANIARDERDLASAREQLEEALDLSRQSGGELRIAAVLNTMAELDRSEGRLDAAIAFYEEALAMSRRSAAGEFVAAVLVNLTTALVMSGRLDRAAMCAAEALDIVRANGVRVIGWAALEAAALLASALEDWPRAASLHGVADAQRNLLSLQSSLHDEESSLQSVCATRSALGEARFATAYAAGRSWPYEEALAGTVEWLQDGALSART